MKCKPTTEILIENYSSRLNAGKDSNENDEITQKVNKMEEIFL